MMIENRDNDLRALREFRSALDEPPDGVLVKGRYRLASSEHRPVRRRRQWVLASAGAAAAVAVVVGAAAVAGGGKTPGGQSAADKPSGTPVPTASKVDKDLPVTAGTRAPAGAAMTTDGGATHAKAVAAMDRLAGVAAGVPPLQIGGGKVLYVKTYNLVAGPGSSVHEVWQDPQTAVALRIRRTDAGSLSIDDRFTAAQIEHEAAEPVSLYRPAPAYLASLPTDPLQLLETWRQWSRDTYPGRAPDGMIWKGLFQLLHSSEPFWTPQTRAAIYHAMARMPDVKAAGATIDGRGYDMFCMVRDPSAGNLPECELFDSATGRWAGEASPGADFALRPDNVSLVDIGTQPRPAPAGENDAKGQKVGEGSTATVPGNKLDPNAKAS